MGHVTLNPDEFIDLRAALQKEGIGLDLAQWAPTTQGTPGGINPLAACLT